MSQNVIHFAGSPLNLLRDNFGSLTRDKWGSSSTGEPPGSAATKGLECVDVVEVRISMGAGGSSSET